MRFVRVTVNHDTGELVGVIQQDIPFSAGGGCLLVTGADGRKQRCETFDLGMVQDHDWRDAAGNATHPARHIHDALVRAGATPAQFAKGEVTAEHAGLREILDCPCTHDGIRDRLRAKGHQGLPLKAIAWLAATLPQHQADALGLAGVPIAALKAMERIRNSRDPLGGSRMELLERAAQQLSDDRTARSPHKYAEPLELARIFAGRQAEKGA
jgi:hypothetical protein